MWQEQARLIQVLTQLIDDSRFSKDIRELAEEKLKAALNSIQF